MPMEIELTKRDLATVAGYTYHRLHEIDRDLPNDKKLFVKTGSGKYDLSMFVQRWVNYNVDRNTGSDMSLEDAKAMHEQIKLQKTQLEVARMKGELVEVNEVRRLWAIIANNVVQNMLRLPTKIGQQVYMLDNQELVIGIIDKEIRDVLTAISETPLPTEVMDETEDEEEETAEEE